MQAREAKVGVEMISSEGELRARLLYLWVVPRRVLLSIYNLQYICFFCSMLVYSMYCIVVFSLLFSPSIDKRCICKMSLDLPASISL